VIVKKRDYDKKRLTGVNQGPSAYNQGTVDKESHILPLIEMFREIFMVIIASLNNI
jgi:hypothetical protein